MKRGHLLSVLGVGFGLAVTVGNTIGSGILRTPGEVARHVSGSAAFLGIWLLGAVYAALAGNAMAELAGLTRQSGGYVVLVRRGLGTYAGFLAGWTDWLSTCSSATAAAIVVGEYALGRAHSAGASALATGVLVALALVQLPGVRSAGRAQGAITALKGAALVGLALLCIVLPVRSAPVSAAHAEAGLTLAGIIVALQSVIFTYDGFQASAYFTGEMKDPGRDVPRSIFLGLATVAGIYLLLNAAFLRVVPLSRMRGDPFVAASAARGVFGPAGDHALRVLMVISLLAAINAFHLMASRALFALADQQGVRRATHVNAGGTPTIALGVSAATTVLFLLTGAFEKVLAITAYFFVANYTLTFLSVFLLRAREPDTPRPYRAWGHPFTTGVVLIGSVAFLVAAVVADPADTRWALLLLAASYPLFRLVRGRGGLQEEPPSR